MWLAANSPLLDAFFTSPPHIEISEGETDSRRVAAWRDKVRPTKRGEKVIQGFLIRKIDHGKLHRHFVPVSMQDIIETKTHIEQVTGGDPWRILIVIFGAVGGNLYPQCAAVRV